MSRSPWEFKRRGRKGDAEIAKGWEWVETGKRKDGTSRRWGVFDPEVAKMEDWNGSSVTESRVEIPHAVNELSRHVIRCAIEVHRTLGPGLLERIYEQALVHELRLNGISVVQQVSISIHYKGLEISGQKLDLLIGDKIVIELKSVERVIDVHLAQLLSYMRAGHYPMGLLINFNVPLLKNGIHRRINSKAINIEPNLSPSTSPANLPNQ